MNQGVWLEVLPAITGQPKAFVGIGHGPTEWAWPLTVPNWPMLSRRNKSPNVHSIVTEIAGPVVYKSGMSPAGVLTEHRRDMIEKACSSLAALNDSRFDSAMTAIGGLYWEQLVENTADSASLVPAEYGDDDESFKGFLARMKASSSIFYKTDDDAVFGYLSHHSALMRFLVDAFDATREYLGNIPIKLVLREASEGAPKTLWALAIFPKGTKDALPRMDRFEEEWLSGHANHIDNNIAFGITYA